MSDNRKIVQLAVSIAVNPESISMYEESLYALDSAGVMWQRIEGDIDNPGGWREMPMPWNDPHTPQSSNDPHAPQSSDE